MSADDGFSKTSDLQSLQLTKAADEDLLALVSNLIDQNSELQKKLYELESHKEHADKVVEPARKQAEEILLSAEREAKNRAAAIIGESQAKAKLESDRIIAEAKQKAEEIAKEKIQSAIYQGSEIIDKAQERYQLIIEDAKRKAEEISKVVNQKVKR
jgi:vacuolar-type H+-ATPase subunit H